MLAPPTTALAGSATVPVIVPRSPWAKAIPLATNTNATTQTTLIPIERTFPGDFPDRKLYTKQLGGDFYYNLKAMSITERYFLVNTKREKICSFRIDSRCTNRDLGRKNKRTRICIQRTKQPKSDGQC